MGKSVIVILSTLACASAFIVIPEELPTILSVIYSNIPPIKLGFDTRLGFGFRIGPHTDFQTIIEIGPQINTNPIGMGNETVAKRQSLSRKQFKPYNVQKKPVPESNTDADATGNQTDLKLMDVILGRNSKMSYSNLNDVQFKKITGIDETKDVKSNVVNDKVEKSPTKFVLFT